MPLRTDLAQVRVPAKCLQLRILVQELPSIILCLVCDLSLPGMNLPGPMLGVGLKRRNFIRIVMSSHSKSFTNIVFLIFSKRSCIKKNSSCFLSRLLYICSNLNTNKSSSEAFHIFSSHSLLRRSMVLLILSP